MFDLSAAVINKMVIHHVGNKAIEEPIHLSDHHFRTLSDDEEGMLKQYFLKPFKEDFMYRFDHHTDLELNEAYSYLNELWLTSVNFIQASRNLAQHLYMHSTHPMIKGGEFYVVHLEEVIYEDEVVEAIGLFKSEQKSMFLNVEQGEERFDLHFEQGIDIKKLDKGCIIFNTEAEDGYRVLVHDRQGSGEEAHYWKDDFLAVKEVSSEYTMTHEYMSMCKTFVTEEMPQQDFDRAQQIEILNRSSGYFSEKEEIDTTDFGSSVLETPELIESFNHFKDRYTEERGIEIEDHFESSPQAVKKGKKFFKSVLKLDKNFHIYVHGNADNIEQGYDAQRGMKYYKVYYEEER